MNERSSTTLAYGGGGPPAGADPKSKSLSCAPVTAGCAWPPWLCYASARQPRRLRAWTVGMSAHMPVCPTMPTNQSTQLCTVAAVTPRNQCSAARREASGLPARFTGKCERI